MRPGKDSRPRRNRVALAAVMADSGPMRAGDGEDLLAGDVTGPAAATEATAQALARADGARIVVLVEGVSDQIAVETLARRHGRNLAAEGVTVLPIGGAHGAARYLRRFGPEGTCARIVGLCDHAEAPIVRRGLATAGFGVCPLPRRPGAARVLRLRRGPRGRTDQGGRPRAGHGSLRGARGSHRVPHHPAAAGLAGKGRGGPAAAIPRRGRAAEGALRAAPDRGGRASTGYRGR